MPGGYRQPHGRKPARRRRGGGGCGDVPYCLERERSYKPPFVGCLTSVNIGKPSVFCMFQEGQCQW